jgi:probable F420-dependent oxidoreductase
MPLAGSAIEGCAASAPAPGKDPTSMDVGLVHLPTDISAPIGDVAFAAEERGLRILYVGDHTHIPARRTTPFIAGEPLPDEYYRLLDPFVALATAAARTTTLRLGTCIYLVAQRDPLVTAKQVASLDHVSGGRAAFGIGYGWNVEEAADHHVEWSSRRRRVIEYVAAMKAVWTEERATFHGEFVDFDEAMSWPKPVQRPHPPVLIGAGTSRPVVDDICTWADGWIPVPFLGHTPDDVTRLRQAAEDRGRDPSTLRIVVDGLPPTAEWFDPWVALGVDEILVPVPSGPMDEVLAALDGAAEAAARYATAADPTGAGRGR